MKEIDTETSVIWPSWCYSDKPNCNSFKDCSEIEQNFDVKKMLSERSLLLGGYINSNTIGSTKTNCELSHTLPLAEVALSGATIGHTIIPTTTAAATAAYLYLEKVKNERMSPRVTTAHVDSLKDAIMESSAAAAVAAAMVNNNNCISITNNNNNNNNNNNIIINSNLSHCVSSGINSSSNTKNNLVNSQVQNQISYNSIKGTSDELDSHSLTRSGSQTQQQQHQSLQKQPHRQQQQLQQQQQQQQQQLSLHMNNNHVKKERLSPSTNGDLQTPLTRSRSTTPSSFRGTSPQNSVHSSPPNPVIPMNNLSTNLLNSIHQVAASSRQGNLTVSSSGITSANSVLPTEFSTRNYSDFMRSLAAKYNNSNPNENLKRSGLFEATSNNATVQKKISAAVQKASYSNSPSIPLNKEITIKTTSTLPPPAPLTSVAMSPGDPALKLSQQNKLAAAVANAAAACSGNVSPYMTSFLSSLPFSPGIFPPLIDMSSTQALITLARAAKENEIHNILTASTGHPKRSAASTSPTSSTSLNIALQQAAQFISPALIYSAQLQKQQLQQQQQQSQVSGPSSPHLANTSNSTTSSTANANRGHKVNTISPLDLSSQPPATKRFKAESTSSQSSIDGVTHAPIIRRTSSSTATMSPSPPPLNETSLNVAALADPTPSAAASALVVPTSKTAASITTFTPIKVARSTSATSNITPAVTVRQCQAHNDEMNSWTVDDVCAFVGNIDICAEYVKHFRDQCIDGSGLPLLTEDHLVNSLGMKLGPALKLRSVLAKKLGGPCPCVSCVAQVQQLLALQATGIPTATTAIHASGSIITDRTASCNNHLANNLLSANNTFIPSVDRKEIMTTATSSINNPITVVCNNDGSRTLTPRSNSNPTDISTPPPSTSAAVTQQQQHPLNRQQQSPIQNISSSNNNNNSNPIANRHDSVDSSS